MPVKVGLARGYLRFTHEGMRSTWHDCQTALTLICAATLHIHHTHPSYCYQLLSSPPVPQALSQVASKRRAICHTTVMSCNPMSFTTLPQSCSSRSSNTYPSEVWTEYCLYSGSVGANVKESRVISKTSLLHSSSVLETTTASVVVNGSHSHGVVEIHNHILPIEPRARSRLEEWMS